MSLKNITLNWHIFSYGYINSSINWTSNILIINSPDIDLIMQILYYWGPIINSSINLEVSHISLEELNFIFDTNISKNIPIYNNEKHILAPIFITQDNTWHMGVIFLLDASDYSFQLYIRLKKLYTNTQLYYIILNNITGYDIIKYNNYNVKNSKINGLICNTIWMIGIYKIRLQHILLSIYPYLPKIKIQRTQIICYKNCFALNKSK